MPFRRRCSLARKRLRHCNYILFGLMLALAGAWEELKPMVADLLGQFISQQNVGLIMTVVGIVVILVRAIAAMRAGRDGPPPTEEVPEQDSH